MTDHTALIEALEQLAERQRDQRGDMLYRGSVDPEIELAIAALRAKGAQS